MQLLNVLTARSTWLFDVNDLNPRGKSFFSDLIVWLRGRYGFSTFPSTPSDVDQSKGLAFKGGKFQTKDKVNLAVELIIYTDGLVANTYSSTEDTDMFIEDALAAATSEFDLNYTPEMIRQKLYLSEIGVRLNQSLAKLNPKLDAFAARISSVCHTRFEPGGVSFWTDVANSAIKTPPFSIERRVNAPFSENRFFSTAPLGTTLHKMLLAEFEQLLAD